MYIRRQETFLKAALAVAFAIAGTTQLFAQHTENFDSYATNSTIIGQGGWEGWDFAAAANATVVNTQAVSAPNSLRITGTSDAVHPYTGITSGKWTYKCKQYVTSTSVGDTWFILMNKYNGANAHVFDDWSLQLASNASTNTVTSAETGLTTTLVEDAWAEIRCEIDLTANLVDIYYNGTLMASHPWHSALGQAAIECVDLYAADVNSMAFYDDISLQPASSAETLAPTAEQVVFGTTNSGGNLASWAADDNNGRKVCRFFIPNAQIMTRMRLTYATTKTAPTAISFNVKVSAHTPIVQLITLRVENKVSNQFVDTNVVQANIVDGSTYNGAPTGTLSNYVGAAGAMRGEIEIKQTGISALSFPCTTFEFGQMVVTG